MSDLESIIAGCQNNDSEARRALYEKFAPAMMGICVRYVSERETARDILHEGFIKVYTKIGTYSGAGSFEGWIRRIFVTTALEYLRSMRVFLRDISLDDYTETARSFDPAIIDQLSADEILRFIDELPIGFKTVFNLHAIEGYSHAEIAQMINIKEGTSRSQYARARQVLQNRIQQLNKGY